MEKTNSYTHTCTAAGIAAVASAVTVAFCGLSATSIRTAAFSAVLAAAAYSDIKTRRAGNIFPVLLLLISAACCTFPGELAVRLLGGLTLFIPLALYYRFRSGGGIGGADVKIASSTACVIGPLPSALALAAGLAAGAAYTILMKKIKRIKQTNNAAGGFPLLPFYAVPAIAAAILAEAI